tara:strand:- start:1375 stop:1965 length:591 start_codon:yes stop_codon:yes gene_type:complete
MGRNNLSTEEKTLELFESAMPEFLTHNAIKERIVLLTGEVNELSIASVTHQLFVYCQQSNTEPITLVINTYGGSVDEMFALYDTIKLVSCPIHTVGLGKIMSAGVLLLAAGEKGKRIIGKHARIMIHPITTFTHGTVFAAMNELDEVKRQQGLMNTSLVEESKLTKMYLTKLFKKNMNIYLDAKKALKYGIADIIA